MIRCAACGDDIDEELGEKLVRGPKGDPFHIDCVLRAKKVPEQLIKQMIGLDDKEK